MAKMNMIIKDYLSSGDSNNLTKNKDELSITTSISNRSEKCLYETQFGPNDGVLMGQVSITLRANTPLSKLRVSVDVQPPMSVSEPIHLISSLSKLQLCSKSICNIWIVPGDSQTLELYCFIRDKSIPHSLELIVNCIYLNSKGAPNIVTNLTTLPLRLVVKPCSPIKDADYKVTISTNKPAVSLLDLFPGKFFLAL